MLNKKIGLQLKLERISKNVSVQEISRFLNVCDETYRRYEKGETSIDAKSLVKVLKYLNSDLSIFFTKVCEDVRI